MAATERSRHTSLDNNKIAHQLGGDAVDGDAEGGPPVDDDGEDAEPDGDHGDDDEGRRADGAHLHAPRQVLQSS